MAKDVSDTVKGALNTVVREAVKNAGGASGGGRKKGGAGPLSGARGLAAGAGLAALVPVAKKGVDRMRSGGGLPTPSAGRFASNAASKAGDRIGANLKDVASESLEKAGGAGGIAKEAAGGLLPFGGGGDDNGGGKNKGLPGVGKGRRMPVQQSIDVAVPLETAYNQWTQYEDWPDFMHRVTRVTQEEDNEVTFATKIWGKTKEFKAEIVTQRPDDRVVWRVSQGITHTGVVSFHELAPRLTRVELSLDIAPGSLIEKAARGMRHVKRAARADLHRYKAFIEMQETETGAWRGRIEDGEVVEEHDESYDKDRDYSEVEDLQDLAAGDDQDEDSDEDDEERDTNGQPEEERRERFRRQAEATRSGSGSGGSEGGRSRRAAAASRSSSSRSTGGRSRSGGSSKGNTRSKPSKSQSKAKARRS
jgi:uncharacterized membrane protein